MKTRRCDKRDFLIHPIPPFVPTGAKVLVLGSFPSVRSRETGFFYGHPQNRFWKVIAAVFGDETPLSVEEKKHFLARHGIALWDVIRSCTISGSSDASIRDVSVNDIGALLKSTGIGRIYTNGKKAHSLYMTYVFPHVGKEPICLPSTSPANAACGYEKLIEDWSIIK